MQNSTCVDSDMCDNPQKIALVSTLKVYRCESDCDTATLVIGSDKFVCYHTEDKVTVKCPSGFIALSHSDFNINLQTGPYGKCTAIENNVIYEEDEDYPGLYHSAITGTVDDDDLFTVIGGACATTYVVVAT